MPTYKYQAKKGPQEVFEGTIEARSESEAVEKLSQMGYLPTRIEEEGKLKEQKVSSQSIRGRVKPKVVTLFSRQLSSLLKSGVSILDSLTIIAEQSENQYFRKIINTIHDEVKEGQTFSAPLAKFPKAFSPLYIAMVKTGEDSGTLPEVLLRIAEYRSKEEEMLARFRMALAYPIFMAIVGCLTIAFMFAYVMPRLTKIYVDLKQNLPLPTQILLAISNTLQKKGAWVVVFLSVVILFLRRYARTKEGKLRISQIRLKMPLFGVFVLKHELSRFCHTLSLLVHSGISILRAINIAIPVLDNEIVKNHLRQSYKDLEEGGSFGWSLKKSEIFPLFMSNLIIVGEKSGKIDEALTEVAASYERDTDDTLKFFATLLEPVMILVMGLIVGFIVIAMLLPIFEINVIAS